MSQRILLVLAGFLTLGGLVWHLLSSRPFAPAPDLSHLRPRPSGRPAPSVPAESTLPRETFATQRAATPPLTETENILLAGIDTRPDFPSAGGRTDALVLVVLHRRSGHLGLVGIPRDLVLELPEEGVVRINTIYKKGVAAGGPQRGADLLKRAVRHLFGLTVDHTIFVDHAGFEALVDTLDGVAVRVVCPIHDRFIDPRGVDGRLELKLVAGVHWMDGKTALMFARSRHGRGVVDRARRQQAVLLGLRDRLAQLGPSRVVELTRSLTRTVYTDMRTVDLVRLTRAGLRVRRDQIHGLVIDWRHVQTRTLEDGRRVMLPKPEVIHAALGRLFRAGTPGFRKTETCPPMSAGLRPGSKTKATSSRSSSRPSSRLDSRATSPPASLPRGADRR